MDCGSLYMDKEQTCEILGICKIQLKFHDGTKVRYVTKICMEKMRLNVMMCLTIWLIISTVWKINKAS